MDQNPTVGIAGSRLEDPDGTPQRSAFRFKSPLGEFEGQIRLGPVTRLLSRWVVAPPVVDCACKTDWVAGASMIVRRNVFDQAGLLDEGYFTYYDDIDFCFSARKCGWPTWYVPASRVVHLVGRSTGVNTTPRRLPPYLLEARRRYFLKHYSPAYAAMVDGAMIIGQVFSLARPFLTGNRRDGPPHLLAILPAQRISKGLQIDRCRTSGTSAFRGIRHSPGCTAPGTFKALRARGHQLRNPSNSFLHRIEENVTAVCGTNTTTAVGPNV